MARHGTCRRSQHHRLVTAAHRRRPGEDQRPWRTRTVEDTFDATLGEHRAITEAIREDDAETARLRMLAHHEHDRDTRIRQKVRRDTGGGLPPG
ncbi:hypothetical protein ACGF5O_32640 [Streptomyces sp. NPDC048291]|uniref:hypothetical protein n=1 Tax=Streptomyces sp. NPDC048291 TaxID=3365530 RepID=UPI0037135120